jgi:hypothetical protein
MAGDDDSYYDSDEPFVVQVGGRVNTTIFDLFEFYWPLLIIHLIGLAIVLFIVGGAVLGFAQFLLAGGWAPLAMVLAPALGFIALVVGGTMALAKVL